MAWHDYLLPCFFLLDRSSMFRKLLLDNMGSLIGESGELPFLRETQLTRDHPRKIKAIVSIISMMSMDVKMRKVLSSCQTEIDNIFRSILLIQVCTFVLTCMSLNIFVFEIYGPLLLNTRGHFLMSRFELKGKLT